MASGDLQQPPPVSSTTNSHYNAFALTLSNKSNSRPAALSVQGFGPSHPAVSLSCNATLPCVDPQLLPPPSFRVDPTPRSLLRHKCTVEGCPKDYKYKGDRDRHFHSHLAPRFLCPVPRCKFSEQGFHRKDHFMKHLKTHPNLPQAWIDEARKTKPEQYVFTALHPILH